MESQREFGDTSFLIDALKKSISSEEVNALWQLFWEENRNKKTKVNAEELLHKIIEIGIVASGSFALAFLSGKESDGNCAIESMLIQIVNTEMSIYKLTVDGFEYQAEILFRNLLELYVILIYVLLDKDKRELFQKNSEDSKTNWYRYFRFPKMMNTIKNYEDKVGFHEFSNVFEDYYSTASSYVHNDFMNVFMYAHSSLLVTDPCHDNLFGSYVTRTDKIFYKMAELCFVSLFLFTRIIKDGDTDITENEIYGDKTEITPYYYWTRGCELVPIMAGALAEQQMMHKESNEGK